MEALGWGCGGAMAKDEACMNVIKGLVAPTPMTHTLVKSGNKAGHVATEDEGCCTIF